MRFKSLIFFTAILLGLSANASANNLQISNVSIEDRDATLNTAIVEFDISWDNSWRNVTNYDAAWIVLKIQYGTTWSHGILDAAGRDPSGTSPGSDSNLEIFVPSDNRDPTVGYYGAFIYRKSSGTGTVTSRNVRLKLDYGLTGMLDTYTIKIKVVGVEMVYIPEGPFYAGDTSSTAGFKQGSSDTDPWYIDSDATIRVNNAASDSFYYTSDGNTAEFATGTQFTIPGFFPTGYDAFYCMKYEVSEGLWIDFFNSLNTYKITFDITAASGKNSDSVIKRNTLSWSSGDASGSRSDRALNYIGWLELSEILDWLSLRPMTELEYEKAARGELASVSGEYAWGSTSITAGVTFSGSPEDGNETFSTANANAVYNITTFSQGDDMMGAVGAGGAPYVQGPARSGIFATSSSTRSSSGAGYYGVMELSGNVWERTVTFGNTFGQYFYPTNGIGSGEAAGNFGWPGLHALGGANLTSSAVGLGFRGGGWRSANTELRISDRSAAAYTDFTRLENASYSSYGGRGVRSAVAIPAWSLCGNTIINPPEQCDDTGVGNGLDYECAGCICQSDVADLDGICDL